MPVKPISIGTLKGTPGRLTYASLPVFTLPTGNPESIPVLIAQGKRPGPCIWITTGIHGNEHSGLNIVHQLVTPELARILAGTLVVVPALNPAGLRIAARRPYYVNEDPNRLFPAPPGTPAPDEPRSPLELAFQTLFNWITASADYLIDLHNAWTGSLPFVFRDRVWFHRKAKPDGATRANALDLLTRTDALIEALGISVVNEFPMKKYVEEKLHRSVSGSVLNVGRVPAITVELGTGISPDPAIHQAGVTGLTNVLKWAKMLEGELDPITTVPVVRPPFAVRRHMGPRVPESCIVRHLVHPGDMVRVGDPVAEMTDLYGRQVAGGYLLSEHDGWVMGLTEGVVSYPGEPVVALAIKDDAPLLAPYPG